MPCSRAAPASRTAAQGSAAGAGSSAISAAAPEGSSPSAATPAVASGCGPTRGSASVSASASPIAPATCSTLFMNCDKLRALQEDLARAAVEHAGEERLLEGQHRQHALLDAALADEVDHLHAARLAHAVHAADALLQHGRVPRQVHVDHHRRGMLQVQAHAAGVGGQEQPASRVRRGSARPARRAGRPARRRGTAHGPSRAGRAGARRRTISSCVPSHWLKTTTLARRVLEQLVEQRSSTRRPCGRGRSRGRAARCCCRPCACSAARTAGGAGRRRTGSRSCASARRCA